MIIKTIGSGSKGNAYIVESDGVRYLLECGVKFKDILKGCNGRIPKYCLLTHEHNDHSKSVHQLVKRGITIVCSNGTAKAVGLNRSQYVTTIENVTTLDAEHDCIEPLMFVIDFPKTGERVLFATDTKGIPYKVKGVSHLLIETNWSEFTVDEDCDYFYRSEKTHMSLEYAKYFIQNMDQSRLCEVRLIHLSNGNSNVHYFKEQIQGVCGVPVYVEGILSQTGSRKYG